MTDIPENALVARQMYAEGASIEAIMAATGLNHVSVHAVDMEESGATGLEESEVVEIEDHLRGLGYLE